MQREQGRIVIVGGGIAGLSTAWYLQRQARQHDRPLAITIVERDTRVGGKLLTERIDLPQTSGSGVAQGAPKAPTEPLVVEAGPDAFIAQKPWGLQLARELGLEDQLISTRPARHKVYVLHKGRPHPLPDGVNLVVPTKFWPFVRSPIISWRGKLRMALDLVLPARRDPGDETLAGFIRRRFGAEALDKIAEPLMAGIHNAESHRQSLQATFPRFREVENRHRSVILGMRAAARAAQSSAAGGSQPTSPFVGLRGGIEQLVEALRAQLDATIETGLQVVGLEPDPTGSAAYQVRLDDGRRIQADAVVLAVPSFVAADLLEPTAPELAAGLRQIRYVSTGTVSLAFRRSESGMPLDSYGLVIPASERRRINAVTINSRKFAHRAPDDYVLLRAFVGGSRNPDVLKLDDEALTDLVRAELRSIFGLAAAPVWSRVYRWPLANPQYDIGHFERIAALEQACPAGLYLCGSAYRGVGIPDCARQGQETAAAIGRQLEAINAQVAGSAAVGADAA